MKASVPLSFPHSFSLSSPRHLFKFSTRFSTPPFLGFSTRFSRRAWGQEPPGAARSSQGPSGAAMGHQKPPGAGRRSQRPPGTARSSQGPPDHFLFILFHQDPVINHTHSRKQRPRTSIHSTSTAPTRHNRRVCRKNSRVGMATVRIVRNGFPLGFDFYPERTQRQQLGTNPSPSCLKILCEVCWPSEGVEKTVPSRIGMPRGLSHEPRRCVIRDSMQSPRLHTEVVHRNIESRGHCKVQLERASQVFELIV